MYGSPTPKRQYAWSNSGAIRKLDIGWKRMRAKVPTVEHYINKTGRKCWKGTKHLKATQTLDLYRLPRVWNFIVFWFLKCNLQGKGLLSTTAFGVICSSPYPIENLQLREYPVPFADNIVKLREELISSRPHEPFFGDDLPSGPQILLSTPHDEEGLFATANLRGVYSYLRGGAGLRLPPHWREYMPHELPFPVPFLDRGT